MSELRRLINRVTMKSRAANGQPAETPASGELVESERAEVAELELEMFDSLPLNGLLRTLTLYVARAQDCSASAHLSIFEREQLEFERRQLERRVRLLGGQVHTALRGDTSHVIIPALLDSRYTFVVYFSF